MFTIRDRTGNIVGFSGRLMDKENPKKLPKYINTGDTAVYKKVSICSHTSSRHVRLRPSAQ